MSNSLHPEPLSRMVNIIPLALGTKLTLKASCTLIQDGQLSVLVDAGYFASRDALEQCLRARAGLNLSDIDILFFTHLHFDHYDDLGFADIPQVMLSRRIVEELETLMSLRDEPGAYEQYIQQQHDYVSPIFMRQFMRLREDPRYDLAQVSFRHSLFLAEAGQMLTRQIKVIDLPGHCLGQLGLEMQTQWGHTVIAADAVLSAEDFAQEDVEHHLVIHDRPALLATRNKLIHYDCVVPSHGSWFNPRTGCPVSLIKEESHV